jgi:hypothetical protein
MRSARACIPVLLCTFAAGASEVEPLLARPITLRRGAIDLAVHGTYTNWSGSALGSAGGSLSGETLALGVDFGATDRVQLGVATALPIDPGAAFGSILGTLAVALDDRSALRLDAGYEYLGVNGSNLSGRTHANRYFGGAGVRVRLPIASTLAFVIGRTSAVDFGNFINLPAAPGTGSYAGATLLPESAADLLVVSSGNEDTGTNIGINLPAGLLFQPDPHLAITLQAGYAAVVAIPSSGGNTVALHFLPVGVEAVVSPVAALDLGGRFFLDGYVARSGAVGATGIGYFNLREVLVWIRFHV